MSDATIFDPLTSPLAGVSLIEASAGTGKTWNLSVLFLRLLLDEEKPLPVHQILVVTFTKAATAELRSRLRDKIKEALLAFDQAPDGLPLSELIASYRNDPIKQYRAQALLTKALANFDRAAIYTIHAFCQRILSDATFDSVASADVFLNDDTALLQRLASDFWRTCVLYSSDYAPLVITLNLTVQKMLEEIRGYLGKPYLHKQVLKTVNTAAAEATLAEKWQAVWPLLIGGCNCFWAHYDGLNKTVYKKKASYLECFDWLATLAVSSPKTWPRLLANSQSSRIKNMTKHLKTLRQDYLKAKCNKGHSVPEHPLFTAVTALLDADQALNQCLQQSASQLRMAMIDWIDAKLMARSNHAQRRMDDLVNDLALALDNDPTLATYIAHLFHAALIDEFQDTDPLQYLIFKRAFIEQKVPLFLVGDPKQAIYGFRGADIFTYLLARQDATQYATLTVNRRAVAPLLSVVNDLFSKPKAFLLDIPFTPAVAAQEGQLSDGYPPVVWHWLADEQTPVGGEMRAAVAMSQAADQMARRVTTLLTTRPLLVKDGIERPIRSHDIAILVFEHKQANRMREALQQYGIGSISLTKRSVFDSDLAKDLLILMQAWADPHDTGAVYRALSTNMVGLDALSLKETVSDFGQLDRYQTLFFTCHRRWKKRSFMAAWYSYLEADALAERLLPLPDGERQLTNLTHLVELIQQQADKKPMDQVSLLTWLAQCIKNPPSHDQDTQERLESDKDLVHIVTIHSSKGMEYPIVCCPFLWHTHRPHQHPSPLLHYHIDNQAHLVARITADPAIEKLAQDEKFADKVRQLYVALTRAQFRLEICWGSVAKLADSPLAWLLYGGDAPTIDVFQATFKKLPGDAVHSKLMAFIHQYPSNMTCLMADTIPVPPPPALPAQSVLTSAVLNRSIVDPWSVSSFSQWADHATFPAGLPDAHQIEEETVPIQPLRYAFPKGTHAGACLHDILQAIGLDAPKNLHDPVINTTLSRYGFNPTLWQEAANSLVQGALTTPLGQGLQLGNIPPQRALKEMEFLLPLAPFQAPALKALLSDPAYGLHSAFRAAAQTFDFSTIGGYLKGFIDLVVEYGGQLYIIDYKLHDLGQNSADYAPDKLVHTIATSHYYLQYLIYAVALRAYLRSRASPLMLSGVRYLFLRGLHVTGNGVWADSPSESLLLALEQLFYGDSPNRLNH